MRFAELLKTTILLTAGAATVLATLAVLAITREGESTLALISIAWWVAAATFGLWLGRRSSASSGVARLLADAKYSAALPPAEPGRILINRLWPLLLLTLLAGAVSFVAPQIPATGAGFALLWTLSWRQQHAAVSAIERRDGASFYVRRTAFWKPIELQRTAGLRSDLGEGVGGSAQ